MAAREPRSGGSDLLPRVLVAVPAAIVAVVLVFASGEIFMVGLFVIGVVALGEFYALTERVRPPAIAGFLTLAALLAAALYGEPSNVIMVLVAAFPVVFLFSLLRPHRENVSWAIAVTLFGVLWIGLAMVHAIWLHEAPHGSALVLDVLIGTFVGDTLAYFGGRLYGRTPLAPLISPNKTIEGLVIGIVGGAFAFWLAGLYQDWLTGLDALIIGVCVAIAAPIGDLFESMLKRDLAVKDTGRAFGAHGGVLDRLDAVFFSIVVGYYAAVALGYG